MTAAKKLLFSSAIRSNEPRESVHAWCQGELAEGASALREGDEALIVLSDHRVFVGTVRRSSVDEIVLRLLGGPSLWFATDEIKSCCLLSWRSLEQEGVIVTRQARGLSAIEVDSQRWQIAMSEGALCSELPRISGTYRVHSITAEPPRASRERSEGKPSGERY